MAQFKVYHHNNPRFMTAGNWPTDYSLRATVDGNDLDDAYELTNTIDGPWWENDGVQANLDGQSGARSTSVGDIIVGPDGVPMVVAPAGFKPYNRSGDSKLKESRKDQVKGFTLYETDPKAPSQHLVTTIRTENYVVADKVLLKILEQKVSTRMGVERQRLAEGLLKEDNLSLTTEDPEDGDGEIISTPDGDMTNGSYHGRPLWVGDSNLEEDEDKRPWGVRDVPGYTSKGAKLADVTESREQRGSQIREPYDEAGYEIDKIDPDSDSVILRDKETGNRELWQKRDDFAGYVVTINGVGYEFARSLNEAKTLQKYVSGRISKDNPPIKGIDVKEDEDMIDHGDPGEVVDESRRSRARKLKEDYNGWKNRQTWNVALWIGNDEGLYNLAKESGTYENFVETMHEMGVTETPDHVAYNDSGLDVERLDELIKELNESRRPRRLREDDHPGFKAVAQKIASKEGESIKDADAELAASSRGASAAAKAKNPALKKV